MVSMPPVVLDAALLRRIAPQVGGSRAARQAAIIDEVGAVLAPILSRYAISTPLRISHFLAQIAHESDGFCTTEEYASGNAYQGRRDLGDVQPGDGPRFKGRGLIQITGRRNYQIIGDRLGLDLVGDPASAGQAPACLLVSCEFWRQHDLNTVADRDDLRAVTHIVNGGFNGLDSRAAYLAKAKAACGNAVAVRPVLRVGDSGADVRALQQALRAHGATVGDDGVFGPATEAALRIIQRNVGIAADGIAGPATRSALAGQAAQQKVDSHNEEDQR